MDTTTNVVCSEQGCDVVLSPYDIATHLVDDHDDFSMAERIFASLGHQVAPWDVPRLVRQGRTIFAFGYGESYDEYDAIEESDLWAWDDHDWAVVNDWGPFRES